MSSINGKEYEQKYGTDHDRAASDCRAKKIYIYKALRSPDLARTYKIIHSDEEEVSFLNSQFVLDPELIWTRRD